MTPEDKAYQLREILEDLTWHVWNLDNWDGRRNKEWAEKTAEQIIKLFDE